MYQAIYEKQWAGFVDEIIGRHHGNEKEVFRVTAADVLLLDRVIRLIDAGSAKIDEPQKLSPPTTPATPGSEQRGDEIIDDGTTEAAAQWYKRLRTPLARSAAKKMMRIDDEAFDSQPTPAFKLEVAQTMRKPSNPSPATTFQSTQHRLTVENGRNFAEQLRRFSVGSSSDGDLTTDRPERAPVAMSQTQLDQDDDLLCLAQQSRELSQEMVPSVFPRDKTLLDLESTILEDSTQLIDSQGSPLIKQREADGGNQSPHATASTQSQDDDATRLEISGSAVHWGCSPILGSPGQLEDPDATVLEQSPIQRGTPASVSLRLETSEDAEWRALQAVTTPVSRHRHLGDTLSAAAAAAHDNDELEPDDLCRRMSAMQMSPVDVASTRPPRSAMLAFDVGSRKAAGRSYSLGSLTERAVDERVIPVLEWMSRKESAEESGACQHGGIVFVHTGRPSLGPALRWTSIPRRLALNACAHLFEAGRLARDSPPTPMGGTLVITSRTRLDEWAEALAGHSELSVHLYTEPLSKRLECDRRSLMGYSVVLTTSDIVRTSEVKHAVSVNADIHLVSLVDVASPHQPARFARPCHRAVAEHPTTYGTDAQRNPRS